MFTLKAETLNFAAEFSDKLAASIVGVERDVNSLLYVQGWSHIMDRLIAFVQ
jgi:hypothetical protein